MSTNSDIEWTTHTFNPWWGCTKVHAGCKNCYAEKFDKRVGGSHWGNSPRRMVLGEWGKPAKWNAAAKAAVRIDSVFCASMCDLFEDYHGHFLNQQGDTLYVQSGKDGERVTHVPTASPVTIAWLRGRVFGTIESTPHLRWLLLTKRPENITRMVPPLWLQSWPANVWTGTSPCDQETANVCIPNLLRVPGRHFLSCEPLVGPIDLNLHRVDGIAFDPTCDACDERHEGRCDDGIDCVIAGGESGHHARPCDVGWLRSLRDQCQAAGVPFFLKQLGSNVACRNDHVSDWNDDVPSLRIEWPKGVTRYQGELVRVRLNDAKGGDMAEWPEDLRVRELPA